MGTTFCPRKNVPSKCSKMTGNVLVRFRSVCPQNEEFPLAQFLIYAVVYDHHWSPAPPIVFDSVVTPCGRRISYGGPFEMTVRSPRVMSGLWY
jgi:hypothetical protein